jgi:hypothetical protein
MPAMADFETSVFIEVLLQCPGVGGFGQAQHQENARFLGV